MTRRQDPSLVVVALRPVPWGAGPSGAGPSGADVRALRAVQARGAAIAIVTAGDFASACGEARTLGIDPWIVAGDGAYVGRGRALLARQAIPACDVAPVLEHLAHRGLATIAIAEGGVHACSGDPALARALVPDATLLVGAPAPADAGVVLAIGGAHEIEAAHRTLAREPRLDVAIAALGDGSHALRIRSRRATLGRAITALATRVGARAPSTVIAGRIDDPFADPSVRTVARTIAEDGVLAALARWHARPARACAP